MHVARSFLSKDQRTFIHLLTYLLMLYIRVIFDIYYKQDQESDCNNIILRLKLMISSELIQYVRYTKYNTLSKSVFNTASNGNQTEVNTSCRFCGFFGSFPSTYHYIFAICYTYITTGVYYLAYLYITPVTNYSFIQNLK